MAYKKKSPLFTGTITPELSTFLRQRRQSLGVTLQQLSHVLHVNWSTIRKWEDGITQNCRQQHIYRLAQFLSGEYDEILVKMNSTTGVSCWTHPKGISPMLNCMERINNMYKICENYPEAGKQLLTGVHEILEEMVTRLIDYSAKNTSLDNLILTQEDFK